MRTYTFADRDGLPMYEYLYRCIRRDILSGELAAGEKLPSKRALAQHLRVSVITVENAYAQLIAEGYVYTREKRGYYVAEVEVGGTVPAPRTDAPETDVKTAWFADFRTNRTPPERFPFSVWARLMRQVLTERDPELLLPMPAEGALPLRQAIAEYLRQFRGMAVSPDCIVVGAGTEYLYNLIVQLLGRDKRYAVEDPGYGAIARVYAACGAPCVPVALDGAGLSVTELRASGADVVHISPGHHFPTGIVTPVVRRQELLAWAAEQPGRYVIEDDYDSEFRFSGRPIPAMQSIDTAGRVLYMNTFSKSLAPSVRISYMVLPPQLLARFRERLGFYACTVPSFEQYTLAKFIAGGYFEQHLARMKKYCRQQRDAVIEAIRESALGGIARVREADAGLHFILEVDTPYTDAELVQRAADRGIRVSCLSEYMHTPGAAAGHQLVINYSGADPARLQEAADRLAAALRPEPTGQNG